MEQRYSEQNYASQDVGHADHTPASNLCWRVFPTTSESVDKTLGGAADVQGQGRARNDDDDRECAVKG